MPFPFGLYYSPGATRRSLAFEEERSRALDVVEPIVARSLSEAFSPPQPSPMERFREVEQRQQPDALRRDFFQPRVAPSGTFMDRVRPRMPGPPLTSMGFLPGAEESLMGEQPRPSLLDEPEERTQQLLLRRVGTLMREGMEPQEAFETAQAELGPALEDLMPQPSRFERGLGKVAGVVGEGLSAAADVQVGLPLAPGVRADVSAADVAEVAGPPAMRGMEEAEKRVFGPAGALGLQVVESPAGERIPGVGPAVSGLKQLQRGVEAAGVPEDVSPLPRTRTFEESFEGGIVRPELALIGDEDAQQRAQEVLEEAGLPRAIAAEIIFGPDNLLPGVGFVKLDDIVRLGRLAGKGTKAAKNALRANPTFRRLLRTASEEAGGGPISRKPVWEMNLDEITEARVAERDIEEHGAKIVFGDEAAKRYETAQRISNSTQASPERVRKADKLIAEMEANLTDEQNRILFGIGEEGLNAEELGLVERSVAALDFKDEASLADSIAAVITRVRPGVDPSQMGATELAAFTRLRNAFTRAPEFGLNLEEVSRLALRKAASRFGDPEDAAFMLRDFARQAQEPSQPLLRAGEPPTPRPREAGVSRGIPGSRFRPPAPEGVRLTNDIPATSAIRQRLIEIDAQLAKPRISGRQALLEERATVQAQADIDALTTAGGPVEEQLDIIGRELTEMQTELQTRAIPGRGRLRGRTFVPSEKDMPMGGRTAAEREGRLSARTRREALARETERRLPDLSTPELNARERVYREFVDNAKFEPVEDATVGRGRFTETGETVQEPTFATEGELQGYRGQQGELGIGAGERPVETSGPLFQQPEAAAPTPRPREPVPAEPPRAVPEAAGGPPEGPPPRRPTAAPQPEEAGNRFAAPLRDFDDVASEVVTSDSPVVQNLMSGINPSVAQNTEEGRVLTAYFRQRVASDELTDVATAAALDPHAQRFTGRTGGVFTIADDGAVKGLRVEKGQSRIWQDVFSRPGDYALTPQQRAFVSDFRQVVDEVESLRVQAGLKPRAKAGSEGWGYVPRQVKGVRGAELRRPSSPGLQRHYEEAQEGVARGVRYDTNPRATLELHVRSAYREIADKQLADALEPLSLTAKELAPAPVRIRMETAVANRKAVERGVRREIVQARKDLTRPAATERQVKLRQRDLRKLESIQAEGAQRIATVRAEYQKAKTAYSRAMDSARRAEIAPGQLFGRTEDTIAIGQWRNRFFPREQADLLKEQLGTFLRTPQKANPFARGVEILGNHIRFLSAIGDFAAPFIQGLPLLARNPVAWGRATLRHYQAWFDPTVQARFIREHTGTFQEMAQHGIPIGDPEFFAALRPGGGISAGRLLEVLPKGTKVRSIFQQAGRQTFGRFQASYNMFLGTARAQMWEALKPSWRGSLDDLGAHIRNMTGGLDSRALGVGPNQRAFESVWMAFSPRLLRSTVALVVDLRLGLRNPKGLEAWRSLGSLVTGAVGVYVAAGLAQGKSEKEIRAGLNPLNGKRFLSYEVNGDWIGIGGQVRAITQLMAAVGSAAAPGGRPAGDLIPFVSDDNPLLQFYQSRGAPALNIVGGVVEAATSGEANVLPFDNIDSLPDLVKHLGTSALPFALQGVLEGEGLITTLFALAGARTSAGTPYEGRRALVQQITGKEEDDLEPGERFDLFEGDEGEAASRFGTDVDTIRQLRDLQREGREISGERFGSPFEERRESVAATATRIETEQLAPAAKGLLAGDPLALDSYNEARDAFFASRRAVSESETARLGIEPSDFEATTVQQKLVDDYYAIEPQDLNGNGFIDKEDMGAFFAERDGVLAKMDAGSKRAIKDPRNFFTDPGVIEVEEMRLEAIGAIEKITALPKWEGLTLEEGEKLDDLVSRITADVQRYKAQTVREGLDADAVTFRSTAEWLAGRGDISELDAENAIAVSSRKAIRAQGRMDVALDNRRVLLGIFPNFFDTVLPVDVERGELTEEEIGQLEPVGVR